MVYDNIKTICEQRGISITQLEKQANLTSGSISKWNKHVPQADRLKAVADVLHVKMDKLLE